MQEVIQAGKKAGRYVDRLAGKQSYKQSYMQARSHTNRHQGRQTVIQAKVHPGSEFISYGEDTYPSPPHTHTHKIPM